MYFLKKYPNTSVSIVSASLAALGTAVAHKLEPKTKDTPLNMAELERVAIIGGVIPATVGTAWGKLLGKTVLPKYLGAKTPAAKAQALFCYGLANALVNPAVACVSVALNHLLQGRTDRKAMCKDMKFVLTKTDIENESIHFGASMALNLAVVPPMFQGLYVPVYGFAYQVGAAAHHRALHNKFHQ